MKGFICLAAVLLSGAIPGFSQTPHRSLASIFNSKLAFYLPEPDSTPVSTAVVNAGSGATNIAQNTWLSIYGTNLAQTVTDWSNADFSKGLPTQLGGVTVTVNNKQAAISFVSPGQVNFLAPLDAATGPVPVTITTQYGSSKAVTPTEQAYSPAFFLVDPVHGYVAAQHLDYSLVGPTSNSVPGYPYTPAKPTEQVILYCTGFGQTNPPVSVQTGSGPLPTNPSVTIGGLPASVTYAGLAGSGLYQLNVIVPASAPNGDLPLVATYNGNSTQTGALITVHN